MVSRAKHSADIDGEFQRAKNEIRSSKNKRNAFLSARFRLHENLVEKIAHWGAPWITQLGLASTPTPRRMSDLTADRFQGDAGLARELRWTAGLLTANCKVLRKYVNWRANFNNLLLAHSSESLLEGFDQLESETGYSLVSIALRIAVLQRCQGLEAQKEFVSNLRANGTPPLVRFYAYWWSTRAEDNTSVKGFVTEFDKATAPWDLQVELQTLVRFLILNEVPQTELEASLLSTSYANPIIDLYEAFVRTATSSIIESRPSKTHWARTIRSLQPLVNDPRLQNLQILLGDDIELGHVSTSAFYQNLHLQRCPLSGSSAPIESWEELLAAAGSNELGNFPNQIVAKIANIARDLKAPGDVGIRASNELSKIALIFGHQDLACWAGALANASAPNTQPFNSTTELMRFVSTAGPCVSAVMSLPSAIRSRYTEYFKRIPNAETIVRANELLFGEHTDDTKGALSDRAGHAFKLRHAIAKNDTPKVLKLCTSIPLEESARENVYFQVASLLELRRTDDALSTTVRILRTNAQYFSWLPLREVVDCVYVGDTNLYPARIDTPILFHYYTKFIKPDGASHLSYTAEDFLIACGVDRPSKIEASSIEIEHSSLVFFLSDVCTLPTLKLFSAFQTERELEDERISVCQLLTKLDPENRERYEDEARALVRSRVIREALQQLQASKISIDEEPLRAWAEKGLREDYDRYRSLYASGLVVVDEEYRNSLLKALETGVYSKSLYDVPQNEASSLFFQMVTKAIQQCSFDPEHGLDSYLSLRIRHGTLSGLIRSGAERERVVTRMGSKSGDYGSNTFWRDAVFDGKSQDEWTLIDERLKQFSRQFDDLINNTTRELIQIRRPDKQNGLFDLSLPLLSVYGLASDIGPDKLLAEFFDACLDIFWARTDVSLKEVRNYLNEDMRSGVRKLFDDLERETRADCAPLADAVLRAKLETDGTIDQAIRWFVLPTPVATLTFRIDELISVALETVKSFHRGFRPHVSLPSLDVPLQGALRLFSDIFYVVFENIYTHCGTISPEVNILTYVDGDQLITLVENSLTSDRIGDIYSERVQNARERIKSGSYLSDLSREGGTGFPKLAKLIGYTSEKATLDFGMDAIKRIFWVEFVLPVRTFSIGDEKDANENFAG